MKFFPLFLLTVTSLTSISTAQEKFALDGHVTGYPGTVRLILNLIGVDHQVDMVNEQIVYMIDGKFQLAGDFPEPQLLSIRIRPDVDAGSTVPTFDFAFIWIENKSMKLRGEKGNFKNAHVEGSTIQDENERLQSFVNNQVKSFSRELDSLKEIKKPSPDVRRKLEQMAKTSSWYLDNRFRLDYAYLNPNSFIGVHTYSWFITWLPDMVTKEKAKSFYASLDESFKNSVPGLQIKNYIDNILVNRKLKIGDAPYEFALPDSSGVITSLNSLKGKVILVDFWGAGCAPCRTEHANYSKAYERFKNKGFEIVSVSQDKDKKTWMNAARKDNVTWISLWDQSMAVSKYIYLVSAIPQNYLIDANGKIISENLRGDELQQKLEGMLGK
jgi:peroxiredoxin